MATTNQPANAENWLGESTGKIPSMLNVLTILTYIGNGLGVISSFYTYFTAPSNYDKIVQAQDKLDQVPGFLKSLMGPDPVGTARRSLDNRLAILLLSLVGCVLCFYGALQMRKLKKTGFSIYIIGDLVPYIALVLFIGTTMLTSFGGLFGIVITIVFVILYASQLKYMK
jgi:hypothetical protein